MKRAVNLAILGFLLVQLILPIRGLLLDPMDGLGNFSWNMYSRAYAAKVRYVLERSDGQSMDIDWQGEGFFKERRHGSHVLNRPALASFNEYLCDVVGAAGDVVRVTGSAECFFNGRPGRPLMNPDVDLCSAPDFGVLDRPRGD